VPRLIDLAPALLVLSLPLSAQSPRQVTLATPDASLAEEFALVSGVRPLADGRLLVSDRLDERVVVVDLARGTVRPVGRSGSGPAEYLLPGRLFPWPGDSTLLVDEGNSRLAVIGPDLVIRRSFSMQRGGSMVQMWPSAVDGSGTVYVQVPRWTYAPRQVDSVGVLRWNPLTDRIDSIATVFPRAGPPPVPRYTPGLPYIPYSPADQWTVTPAGEILILRGHEFRLDRRATDGSWRRGPALPWTPIAVTLEDKRAAVRRFNEIASSGNRGGAGRPPGATGALPAEQRTEEAVNAMVKDNTFAPTKPPFTDQALHLGPDGSLWYERSDKVGAPSTLEALGPSGTISLRVALPAGRRLVGVGKGVVYLAARDADGIERLERYALR